MQIATPRGASSLILGLLVAIAANALWPTLSDAVGLDGDALRYGLAGGAGLLSMLGFMSLGRGGPQPGEYWMALVPFAERPGAKDRPCLVIKRGSRSCSVLYITSQDKMGDPYYLRINNSDWKGQVRRKTSWIRVSERNGSDPAIVVDRMSFRRKLGRMSRRDAAALKRERRAPHNSARKR